MENITLSIVATILGVLVLLGVGYLVFNQPDIPACPKCPELSCPSVEPVIQTKTIVDTIEVPVDYKQKVVDALLSEASEDRDFRECNDEKFNIDEISVKRVYDGFVLEQDSEGDTSISDVRVKLNYDNGKCYRTFVCGLDTENELICED